MAKYYVPTEKLRLGLDTATARDAAVRADPVVPRLASFFLEKCLSFLLSLRRMRWR